MLENSDRWENEEGRRVPETTTASRDVVFHFGAAEHPHTRRQL
jgi:hypothetical protein